MNSEHDDRCEQVKSHGRCTRERHIKLNHLYILTPEAGRFFFFQAEDGIRYLTVTGVQTCALPIFADLVGAVKQLRVANVAVPVTADEALRRLTEDTLVRGNPADAMLCQQWQHRLGDRKSVV